MEVRTPWLWKKIHLREAWGRDQETSSIAQVKAQRFGS